MAIRFREPDYERVERALLSQDIPPAIGTPTLVELGIVVSGRLGRNARSEVDELLRSFHILEVAFGEHHWREAVSAFSRYGRGRHQASLNFGDCMTYAIAKLADEPLLFVGEDFAHTDLTAA